MCNNFDMTHAHAQKEITSQTDSLSSKTYVFEDNLTNY